MTRQSSPQKRTMNILRFATPLVLALCGSNAHAWKQSYPQPLRKYSPATTALDAKLDDYWNKTWKAKFIDSGLVKSSDSGYTTVYMLEGQAQGLLLSLWMNDETTFRALYEKMQEFYWVDSKGLYVWEIGRNKMKPIDTTYKGGAELDIAGALICASALVDAGKWTDATPSYKAQAKTLIQGFANTLLPQSTVVRPWPGAANSTNPSHNAVHWYPVFKQFCNSNRITGIDWVKAHKAAYALFKSQPNSDKGMVRNWSSLSGGASGCTSCTAAPLGIDDMGADAIRVPWRIGLDAIWHRDSSAIAWLRSTWSAGFVNPAQPGMYELPRGMLLGWCDSAQTGCRPSYERSLTRAMWGASAAAAKDSSGQAQVALNTILPHFVNNAGNDYIGEVPAGAVDVIRNRYVTQTLSLLGLLTITGNTPDIWGDLKNAWVPPPKYPLHAYPDTIRVGGTTRLVVRGEEPVHWILRYKPRSSGAQGAWTVFFTSPLWRGVDSGFAIKGDVAGYNSGDTLDLQAFWEGSADTSKTALIVVGPPTSVAPRQTSRLASFARLDGALLVLPGSPVGEAVATVRFLGADGSVAWSTSATPTPEGLVLDHPPALRGIHVFEVLTPTGTIRGRLLGM